MTEQKPPTQSYRLGDTVRIELPAVFKARTEKEIEEDFRTILRGEFPKWVIGDCYGLVCLTTQEMVDEFNAYGTLQQTGEPE